MDDDIYKCVSTKGQNGSKNVNQKVIMKILQNSPARRMRKLNYLYYSVEEFKTYKGPKIITYRGQSGLIAITGSFDMYDDQVEFISENEAVFELNKIFQPSFTSFILLRQFLPAIGNRE